MHYAIDVGRRHLCNVRQFEVGKHGWCSQGQPGVIYKNTNGSSFVEITSRRDGGFDAGVVPHINELVEDRDNRLVLLSASLLDLNAYLIELIFGAGEKDKVGASKGECFSDTCTNAAIDTVNDSVSQLRVSTPRLF